MLQRVPVWLNQSLKHPTLTTTMLAIRDQTTDAFFTDLTPFTGATTITTAGEAANADTATVESLAANIEPTSVSFAASQLDSIISDSAETAETSTTTHFNSDLSQTFVTRTTNVVDPAPSSFSVETHSSSNGGNLAAQKNGSFLVGTLLILSAVLPLV